MKPISPFNILFFTVGLERIKGFSLSLSSEVSRGCCECSYTGFHLSVTLKQVFNPPFLTTGMAQCAPHLQNCCALTCSNLQLGAVPSQSWQAPAKQPISCCRCVLNNEELKIKQAASSRNAGIHLPSPPISVHKDQAKIWHGLLSGWFSNCLLFSTLDDTCYVNVVFTSREMKVVTNFKYSWALLSHCHGCLALKPTGHLKIETEGLCSPFLPLPSPSLISLRTKIVEDNRSKEIILAQSHTAGLWLSKRENTGLLYLQRGLFLLGCVASQHQDFMLSR